MVVGSIAQEDSMEYKVTVTKRENGSRFGYEYNIKDDADNYIISGWEDTKRKAKRKAKKHIKVHEESKVPTVYTITTSRDSTYVQENLNKDSYDGTAYCTKCKESVPFYGTIKTSDSGRRMASGRCGTCNTKVNRILTKADK